MYESREKKSFMLEDTEYLGIKNSLKSIIVDSFKVQVMKKWPDAATIKKMQNLLSSIQFFRRFIKHFLLNCGPTAWLHEEEYFDCLLG